MTLIEFIKSRFSQDDPIGDLSRDIFLDRNFPFDKSDSEIISYLKLRTKRGDTYNVFKKFLKEYEKHLHDTNYKDEMFETNFLVLYSEQWQYYKENFIIDKVYLVGKPNDIYRVYCVDSMSKTALSFNLKSESSLNDIRLIDENKILLGNLTKQHSIENALTILKSCPYETPEKPNKKKFSELLDFLKRNLK